MENMVDEKRKGLEKKIKKCEEMVKKEQTQIQTQTKEEKVELQPEITKFFRNYVLELFGSTVLEAGIQEH